MVDATWCFREHRTASGTELSAVGLLPARTLCDEQRLCQLRHAVWKCSPTFRKTGQDRSIHEVGTRRCMCNAWTLTGLGSQLCTLRRPCIYHTRSGHHSSFKNTSFIVPGQYKSARWPSAIPPEVTVIHCSSALTTHVHPWRGLGHTMHSMELVPAVTA